MSGSLIGLAGIAVILGAAYLSITGRSRWVLCFQARRRQREPARTDARVAAIYRNEQLILPSGNTVIEENDSDSDGYGRKVD